jgi:hypothetical protein
MKDFFQSLGSVFMGPGAFGDPKETYSLYAPPGLLSAVDEAEQERLGRQIQAQMRKINADYRPNFSQVQSGLVEGIKLQSEMQDAAAKRQQAEALQQQLAGVFGMGGAPQSVALTPEANAQRAAANQPGGQDRRASASRYFQAAKVFAAQGNGEMAKKYLDMGMQLHPNPSEAVRDLEYFGFNMQGQGTEAFGRLKQLNESKSQKVNVNTAGEFGPIPAGFRLKRNPDGTAEMEPIPGSPAAREIEDDASKKRQADESQGAVAGFTLRDARIVDEAIDQMAANPVVRLGKAKIPGTAEYRANQFMDSLRGTIAIEQLLNIKRQGAGLGQVPQAQLDMLSFLMGKLDMGLPKDDLRLIIGDIQTRYREILQKMSPEDRALIGIADREYNSLTSGGGSSGGWSIKPKGQ